ncbi:hypothetical protein RISK_002641 [Rhodopirellula islandica]|uniref:Uncharacterized protein n=1 Tax=Rhodopirellula islandica TaxID=595434 RepID=A0A0J1BFA8_RHOIS|nr:hypothetical protein RISK_002641 [Rhodopirellula islandica]
MTAIHAVSATMKASETAPSRILDGLTSSMLCRVFVGMTRLDRH